jgi:hypothetical protein
MFNFGVTGEDTPLPIVPLTFTDDGTVLGEVIVKGATTGLVAGQVDGTSIAYGREGEGSYHDPGCGSIP